LLKEITKKEKMENDRLILFLRNLADSVEQDNLLPLQLESIGEFFMKYKFQEKRRNDDDGAISVVGSNGVFNHDELVKFIVLGWYIYCIILKEERGVFD
jgi:hypothetical protein